MRKAFVLLLACLIVMLLCIGVVFADSVPCFGDQTCYSTKAEAVSAVPTYIEPKGCFVWKDGPPDHPWRVIYGSGCAHWVAHELGLGIFPSAWQRWESGEIEPPLPPEAWDVCYDGFYINVPNVITGRTEYSISQASVGDIWTNTGGSHCGIVRGVICNPTTKEIQKVHVQHCSESVNGVGYTDYSSGKIYKDSPLKSGCCQYTDGCYDGTHAPEKCTVCYGGTWRSGWQCEEGECVPEASTLVLLATGLLFLVGYLGLRRKEN